MVNFSPMTLGTVQLGMNYGIANNAGKPSLEKSFSILETALRSGITALDTARAYGNSEEVIGSFLKTWTGPAPTIITKIPRLRGETEKELEQFATESVEASLQSLGVNKVAGIMLHGSKDPMIHGSACVRAMESLLAHGYTDQVGVSVYTAQELQGMLAHDIFTMTQVPMSVFDQRLIADGSMDTLAQKGISVFVRSVFLQGLFFLDPDAVEDPILLEHAVPGIRTLRQIAQACGMTVAQLAIAFMRGCAGVTSLVLGADNPEQVQSNLSYFDTPLPDPSTMAELKREFANVDIPAIMTVLSRPKQ